MNPPFSQNQAGAHLSAASMLVEPGGRLVAVLPASQRGTDLLPGWDFEWSPILAGEFVGTAVSVAVFAATRP